MRDTNANRQDYCMVIPATEIAERHGLTYREVVATCRQAGVEPAHYVRDASRRMVACYPADVLDVISAQSGFGRMAASLEVTPERLAEIVLDHFPGGNVAVPARYRGRVRSGA